MAYFMVHLKIAQELIKNNSTIKDIGAFYKGTLAPDAIMFRKGCKRSDKASTHFCVGDEGWGYYTNYDEWESNLNLSLKSYADKINSDFLFGYYAHILTDIAFAKRFWNPVRLTHDNGNMESYIKDCEEIDSRLLASLESKEVVWDLLKNSINHSVSDLFIYDDVSRLIDEMISNMYKNREANLDYKFKVITFSDMTDFIDIMVPKINNSKFRD